MSRVYKTIPDAELDAMFEYWYQHDRSITLTAKKFNKERKSLWRWAEKFKWHERADKIRAKVQNGLDRKIEKNEITNVKLAKACLKKEVAAYLKPTRRTKGELPDILRFMRYIDEVEGNMPIEGGGIASIPMTPELAREVRFVLRDVAGAGSADAD